MFCAKCGQQNLDGAQFCSKCGAGLDPGAGGNSQPVRKSSGSGFPVWLIVILVLLVCGIPVLGILAAIAIPQFVEYSARAKMAEVGAIGTQARDSVNRYVLEKGKLPATLEETGFSLSSQQVTSASIDSDSGVISLELGFSPYERKVLQLVPVSDDGKTISSWKCKSDNIPNRHFPPICR